tara:strand:- start:4744 stop:5370 length:627 start_codon:yes stop_codon:yes gene_type:complete
MRKADPRAVAERYALIKQARKINARSKTASRVKTAGEVRFIKDHGDDSNAWAWGQHPPSQRTMDPNHTFNQKCNKNIAKVLRSTLSALGHAMSAYSTFAKIKSRDISPDGNLGGRGYIMEIKAIRRQYMNVVEALSAMSDTLYDEITADHWKVEQNKMLNQVMEEIEEMKDDPEGWALEVEEDDYRPKQLDDDGNEKTRDFASPRKEK